ncbi:hypothetical protein DV735_g156, partial [Chaetothyriales sp. CBS 134920]
MSLGRPSQCVFCLFKRSARAPLRRAIHSTAALGTNKPSRGPKSKGDGNDNGSNSNGVKWEDYYSPEQVAAIRAAEKVIPKGKFDNGVGPWRSDPWAPDYLDNYTEIDPVIDKPRRASLENIDDDMRPRTREELQDAIMEAAERHKKELKLGEYAETADGQDDVTEEAITRFIQDVRLTVGKEEAEFSNLTAMAPSVPSPSEAASSREKSSGGRGKAETQQQELDDGGAAGSRGRRGADSGQEEASPALLRLMQMTGYSREQLAKLRVKSIITHRVANQTRLGKVHRPYILSIAGNGNGMIGIGEGKAEEMPEAKLQSQYRAIRNMQPILRYENRTIFGDLKGKVGATELELYARPPGFGLRCQQYIWEICRCAGIHDLAARVTRARNPMNTVKATVQALVSQKDPEDIARARGKKMVDVRRVYYAGQV